METSEEWMARIGSAAAQDERQRLRAQGTINQPRKGPRGLSNILAARRKKQAHKISCQCEACRPLELPVTVIEHKPKKKPRKRRKWEQRGSSGN